MPRTTTVESPGCPPIRALTFDVLGLVKVIEARGKQGGVPKVVERWGDPDPSRCVLAASINDRKFDPGGFRCQWAGGYREMEERQGELGLAGEGRRERMGPVKAVAASNCGVPVKLVVAMLSLLLAVARRSGLIEVLSPVNGDLRVSITNTSQTDLQPEDDPVVGLHMLRKQRLELSSRKGVEVNVWDLDTCTKIWNAKSPAKDSLGIFTPTWFTSATFLSNDDHRKIVAGTNSHQVRLYDISAQRRPVISIDFRESAIKAVTEDLDGNTVYIGTGSGDLASFDMRTDVAASAEDLPSNKAQQNVNDTLDEDEEEPLPVKRKKASEEHKSSKKLKSKKKSRNLDEDEEEPLPVKRKKASKEHKSSKKLKSKKKSRTLDGNDVDVS
ncbi:transducin/WD40 repeat-like superfamily protein [Actinidia rufa]|uniref:Transducin/WD40 repeat-like superfamily protein n=1 Tax=Actinidia rufa TaxID=165716 RepID=A0A7J0FYQ0_9ERIC|nr:transducin/WD40 repeat-like superfamily protein [Actinidia rufa]